MYAPKNGDLRSLVIKEAHGAPYYTHPGVKKRHADLKRIYSLGFALKRI
jgi:hypothetical protein